jgi:vacuolar-type H+-ATPase subunit B/Vma2
LGNSPLIKEVIEEIPLRKGGEGVVYTGLFVVYQKAAA